MIVDLDNWKIIYKEEKLKQKLELCDDEKKFIKKIVKVEFFK